MSRTHSFLLALGSLISITGGFPLFAQSQPKPAAPTIVVRGSGSPVHSQVTTLRIAVRDVDSPDQPIDQAYVVIVAVDTSSKGRPLRPVLSNDRGIVSPLALEAGEYIVSVRRVGYREARLSIRVGARCEQVLEVYLTQAIVFFDRCQVRTADGPACDPDPPLTPTRATFTTCAPAA